MTALIAVAGAAAGVLVGTVTGKRLYSATGLVRVASTAPQGTREGEANRPMAMFEGFLQAQKDVIASREVLEGAARAEPWARLASGRSVPTAEWLASGLKVETRPRSDHLRVTFSDPSPAVASAAVRSVIASYQQCFSREQERAERQRREQAQGERDGRAAQLRALEAELPEGIRGRTLVEAESLYAAAAERVRKLRGALTDVQCAIAGGPDLTSGAPAKLPADIADDEMVRTYAAASAAADQQLIEARARGLTPAHPTVVRLEALRGECRARLEQATLASEARRSARGTFTSPVPLVEREASLRALTLASEEELRAVGAERNQIAAFEVKAAKVRESLAAAEAKLDALEAEAALGKNGITVITSGDAPLTALVDRRAKSAAVGGAGGVAAAVGALIVLGTRRRRYRFCDEVAADLLPRVPFIAVLPELGGDEEHCATAVHCVHDLRVRLQPAPGGGAPTYLLTSAGPGSGTTGVSVSLALSFAAAGYRTLLIDGDLTSRCLTEALGGSDSAGLREAAAGEEPNIQRVSAGFAVLTAGRCRPHDAFRFSSAAAGRVIAALRARFDVLLIDGDPIVSGLSASVLAPQAEGVLFTLARGQEEALVQTAMARLEAIGSRICGSVYNRALPGDIRKGGRERAGAADGPRRALPESLSRLGPLVGAMLSSLALSREDELKLLPLIGAAARAEAQPEAARRAVA